MKRQYLKARPAMRPARLLPMLALLGVAAGGVPSALAGYPPALPGHFGGVLNDYTPSAVNGVPIKGGPYEMHGSWSLDLDPARSSARFHAEMTMETVDFLNADPNFDPGKLGAHTHHIAVMDGVVHDSPTEWTSMCPKFSPAVTGGFAVTGTAYVTGNGGNAPFGNPSPVTLCVLGGTKPGVSGAAYVMFANFTLTFGAPASTHFGPQAIHGVVERCTAAPWDWDTHACTVGVTP